MDWHGLRYASISRTNRGKKIKKRLCGRLARDFIDAIYFYSLFLKICLTCFPGFVIFPYMKTNHTSGPWHVGSDGETVFADCGQIIAEPQSGKLGVIASFIPHRANAKLIAAAPEMLEALMEASKAFCQLGHHGDPILFKIQDIVAKATAKCSHAWETDRTGLIDFCTKCGEERA